MKKKLHIATLLCCITSALGSMCLFGGTFYKNQIKPAEVKATVNSGYLDIWLYNYTCGGTFDNWNKNNQEYRFIFDHDNQYYRLDVVLYSGDFCCPIIGNNYVLFPDAFLDESTHYSKYLSTNYLLVEDSGTYSFLIDSDIETLSPSEYESIWHYPQSKVLYSSELHIKDSEGTRRIYLNGAFDGSQYIQYTDEKHKFFFDEETKKYELLIGLYKGDVFCPFDYSSNNISYYSSAYSDERFLQNNIGPSEGNRFTALKDGTYRFSISYSVEYLPDKSFTWSKDGESVINYVSPELPPFQCNGKETIKLFGYVHGEECTEVKTPHFFKFDPIRRGYVLNIYLHKDDYFFFSMKHKGKRFGYFKDDSYAKNIFESAKITSYQSAIGTHLYINETGYYEIFFSGNIENLDNPSEIWKKSGNSYIRFCGKEIYSTFLLIDKYSSWNNSITVNSIKDDLYLYTKNGLHVDIVSNVIINGSSLIKIGFDPIYATNFTLTSTLGGEQFTYSNDLIDGMCYTLISNQKDRFLGEACVFIYNFIDKMEFIQTNSSFAFDINSLDQDAAKSVMTKYNRLSASAKKIVDDAIIYVSTDNGSTSSQTKFIVLKNKISSIAKGIPQIGKMISIILSIAFFLILVFFLLLIAKKNSKIKRTRINKFFE